MCRQGAWSDVTPDGKDFLDGAQGSVDLEESVDLGFLFLDCGMAVSRDQDDTVYILEEMFIPIRSHLVALEWVPKLVDRILLLTDQEGVCYATNSKRRVINPQLKFKERNC